MKKNKRPRNLIALIGLVLFSVLWLNLRVTSLADGLGKEDKVVSTQDNSKIAPLFSEHLKSQLVEAPIPNQAPYRQTGGIRIQSRSGIKKRGVSSSVTTGDFRLTGESKAVSGQDFISLDWDAVPDVADGYVVERTPDGVHWETPPTNYGKQIKILNVHPDNGDYLKAWMDQIDPNTGQPVSMGLIDVHKVNITQFIANPNYYLKDSSGKYIYDGVYFGSSDVNNGQDISIASFPAIKDFGSTGRSVIFGHDTIMSDYHPGFNIFAFDLGIRLLPHIDDETYWNDDRLGSPVVRFTSETNNGYLNKYPYLLDPTINYNIQPSHTGGQFYLYNGHGKKWMEYVPPFYNVGMPVKPASVVHYLDQYGNRSLNATGAIGDNNAYLITKKNYAVIQTGHTTGACTPDEAKVIANMVYYTSTLNTTNHGEDHTIRDSAAPDKPEVSNSSVVNDRLDLTINTNDKGIDYYYQVKAKTSSATKVSDKIKIQIKSGIKGYVYQVDDNLSGSVPITRDPVTNAVLNINLNPISPTDNHAQLSFNRSDADKYLHVVAVDNSNNVSPVKTIRLSDYLWWKYENEVLTIYQHELHNVTDMIGIGTDMDFPSITYSLWPWHNYQNQIKKLVIKPGVSAKGSMDYFLYNTVNLETIEGLNNFDTHQVNSMSNMFSRCMKLTSLDLTSFNTSNVTVMFRMFYRCNQINQIKFGPNFDTRNVTNFGGLFEYDNVLESVDVSHFNTRNAIDMQAMFSNCLSLKNVDVSGFDTSNVTKMKWMFNKCKAIKKLNLSSFNTARVTDFSWMFTQCTSLSALDLSNFIIQSTAIMDGLFTRTDNLWKLTMGPSTKFSIGYNLANPTPGTGVVDLDNPIPQYYATAPNWREVGTGSPHAPTGAARTADQIASDSQIRNDTRTYVWDQIGKQTLSTTNSIDFGTHLGAKRNHQYTSAGHTMNLTDNRNVRNGKRWQITGAMTKPLTLIGDNTKQIQGNPIYYVNADNGVETNLTPVAQVLLSGTAGAGYQDISSYGWTLKYQASSKDIPVAGSYKGEVTCTIVNIP